MANDYYNPSGWPVQNEGGDSASGRAEFVAIGAMANKLPAITANGGKVVRVNAGATQLESVDPGLVIDALTGKTTPVDADELPIADSAASFAGKKLTWANLKATLLTYFNGVYLRLAGGNMTGAVNEAITSVASATTPDIWTGQGNIINYTGTVTATGFAAAPQAGTRRVLYCSGACAFTAGPTMLIDGVASGNTLTVAGGDRVEVLAFSTTQFVLRHYPVSALPDSTITAAGDPTYANTSDAKIPTISWVRNAMSAIATAAGFAYSFAANGYIKFPSWLGSWIVQWGSIAANGTTTVTGNFPLTFPTAGYVIIGQIKNQQGVTLNMSVFSTAQYQLALSAAGTPNVMWWCVGN